MPFRIEPIDVENLLTQYRQLFAECFPSNSKLNEQYLAWLYAQNPDGPAVGYDAFDNNRLVAHYACIPRTTGKVRHGLSVLQSVNTATSPKYVGRGLFTQLAAATYGTASEMGYQYVFGVANQNSFYGFTKKLGFSNVGQVRLRVDLISSTKTRQPTLTREKDWLSWRLSNPSAQYYVHSRGEQDYIYVKKRGIYLRIADLAQAVDISSSSLCRQKAAPSFCLTPTYPSEKSRLLIPRKMMPSPWHLILRSLIGGAPDEFILEGIDLDTF